MKGSREPAGRISPDAVIVCFLLMGAAGAVARSPLSLAPLLPVLFAGALPVIRSARHRDIWTLLRWTLSVTAAALVLSVLAGPRTGLLWITKILLLYFLAVLLSAALSPLRLAETLARWLRPLAWLGLPVSELPLALSLGLVLMPALRLEAGRLSAVQLSRGIAHGSWNPIRRVGAAPILISTLLARGRARSESMAISLLMRGYHPAAPGRAAPVSWRDALAVGLASATLLAVLYLNRPAR